MNVFRGIAIVLLFLFSIPQSNALPASSPKKIALIIGIGKYQPNNGWKQIHGDNDIDIVRHALVNTGFLEKDILTLKNDQATKAGILNAFEKLLNNSSPGDIVVLHFSGHGQQISDINGDEADGLDEALVPYDAPSYIRENTAYTGGTHLTDDELSAWFKRIRYKVGANGQLVAFVDACHSGTISRGNGLVRGEARPIIFSKSNGAKGQDNNRQTGSGYFQPDEINNNALGKFVLFTAAAAMEKNHEYREKELGSLSYAIADAFENKIRSTQSSYRDLFEYARNTMALIVPDQVPQLEGDKDMTVFSGEWIVQEPFYSILGKDEEGLVEIGAGTLFGIREGTGIGFFPVGTRSTGQLPVAFGKVAKASHLRAFIKIDENIQTDSLKSLRAFVLSPLFDNTQTKVLIEKLPAELKVKLREQLNRNKITIVDDINSATLAVTTNAAGKLEIQTALDRLSIVPPFDPVNPVPVLSCKGEPSTVTPLTHLTTTITGYAKNSVIKNITIADKDLGLKIRIQKTGNTEGYDSESVFAIKSQAVLTINNTGARAGYFYMIELDPTGKICPLMGFNDEIRLDPGRQEQIPIDSITPPFGKYIIKGYITDEPIGEELRSLISTPNGQVKSAGSTNQFISLLGELMQSPGNRRSPAPGKSGSVFITNYSYVITE